MDDTKRDLDAEVVRQQHLDAFGAQLGPVYHDLYNQCAWLYVKWHQFVELYGTDPERISLLNHAGGLFFRIVHDIMWDDTLLHLCRLTDPASTGMGKKNKRTSRSAACRSLSQTKSSERRFRI
jgi:AbiU2